MAMNTSRTLLRTAVRQNIITIQRRPFSASCRALFKQETDAVTPQTASKERQHPNAEEFRKSQTERPLNPHLTNTTSAIHNEKDVPKAGFDNVPPEFLSKADPNYAPKDEHPENTERMTGGTQKPAPDAGPNSELNVGEIEGGSFRVEPLRRTGEDANTMRARLLCKTRPARESPG